MSRIEPHPATALRCHRVLAVVGLSLACCAAFAQSWEYKSYKKSATGQYDKSVFTTGAISVEQRDGQSYFRMIAGAVDVCYRGALPASVTKTDDTTTIEVTQPITGCEEFRYVIRNDGSGGYKEVRRGERWARSTFDHGLTPKN